MGIRARIAGFAAAGLLVVAPIVMAQQPAGAAMNETGGAGDIYFADYNNVLQHCGFFVDAIHDTSAKTATETVDLDASNGSTDCFAVTVDVTIDYHDAAGKPQRSEARAESTGPQLTVSGAVSNVKVTVTVYYALCDQNANQTCSAVVVTAPK